ncbi:transposase, partial [Orientia tsutsugamushi]|uniref:transposase n=1 Tax=Orientia tsutsugamushi TaxID=784 RepID=UPI000B2BA891
KAYISKKLFHQLLSNGLRLFTILRKDMKTYLLHIEDKRLFNRPLSKLVKVVQNYKCQRLN